MRFEDFQSRYYPSEAKASSRRLIRMHALFAWVGITVHSSGFHLKPVTARRRNITRWYLRYAAERTYCFAATGTKCDVHLGR